MDKELLYNQSGVKDITAYKAISNLRKRGNEKMSGYEINKGEIWQVISGEREVYVVVLNCFERYAATIMLQEQEPTRNAVPVRVRDIVYADAGRLGYVFYDKMVDFVRTLSADEEIELRQAISEALELGEINQEQATGAVEFQEAATEAATAKLEAARQEIAILRKDLAEAVIRMEKAQEEAAGLRQQLERASSRPEGYVELAAALKEAEIYKGLYEQLLARALD